MRRARWAARCSAASSSAWGCSRRWRTLTVTLTLTLTLTLTPNPNPYPNPNLNPKPKPKPNQVALRQRRGYEALLRHAQQGWELELAEEPRLLSAAMAACCEAGWLQHGVSPEPEPEP